MLAWIWGFLLRSCRGSESTGKGRKRPNESLPGACARKKAWKMQPRCRTLTLVQFKRVEPAARTKRPTGLCVQASSQTLFANHGRLQISHYTWSVFVCTSTTHVSQLNEASRLKSNNKVKDRRAHSSPGAGKLGRT